MILYFTQVNKVGCCPWLCLKLPVVTTNGTGGAPQEGDPWDSQTATEVKVRPKGPWTPGHWWSLNSLMILWLVLLCGSCVGTCRISDQSQALEVRKISQQLLLKVHTPISFICFSYNCPHKNIVDMHSIMSTPSISVLFGLTLEVSCWAGSFPCQFNFVSVFDFPVWDEVWEQATPRHFCPFR